MLSLDKQAFIEQLTRDIPPRPASMDAIVAANLRATPIAAAPFN